jgi:hypothetical protein
MTSVQYNKNKNTQLFDDFANPLLLNVQGSQNYIPLYDRFFELNSTNWQNVTLFHNLTLTNIVSKKDSNLFEAAVSDKEGNSKTVSVFFKYSPLLDPNKYITGGYKFEEVPSLPVWNDPTVSFPKLTDGNNAAYIDSFFYYLSSRLKHQGFVHGLDFFGSYLGYKEEFKYMLDEDAEFICNDPFFKRNNGKLFKINVEPPGVQPKLSLGEDCELQIDSLDDSETSTQASVATIPDDALEEVDPVPESGSVRSRSSSASSNSSNSTLEGSAASSSEFDEMEPIEATIFHYPVQIISIEACSNTLDSLLENMKPAELASCLFQVVASLIVYQKMYQFTHNDLHTNNIMFVDTDVPFLHYIIDDTAYSVPTFGKIFKIIDFGRSIYTFENKTFVSDSFSDSGDAATQYNMQPYFNPSKPLLEPNYSFDLCRLACSMIDMLPETPDYDRLNKLIEDWCCDDKGRNVVYKKNGEERYPGFKLYKMISRSVHNHVPRMQLRRPVFQDFIVKKKKLKNVANVLDIDALSL